MHGIFFGCFSSILFKTGEREGERGNVEKKLFSYHKRSVLDWLNDFLCINCCVNGSPFWDNAVHD